jgi:DNA polymerase-3 subunit gamma/tau
MLRSVPDAAVRGLVSAPEDELGRMVAQAERIGLATLSRYAEIVHTGLLEMRGATAPRLVLELLCARMLLPSASESEAAVLQRLERLERRITVGAAPTFGQPAAAHTTAAHSAVPAAAAAQVPDRGYQRPSQRPAETRPEAESVVAQRKSATDHPVAEPGTSPEPVPEPVGGQVGALDAAAVRRVWPELLGAIRKIPGGRSTEAMLTQATVYSVDGSSVTLTHTAEPLARRLSEQHNAEKIAAALHTVLGGTWQVRCIHSAPGAASKAGGPAARPQPAPAAPQRSFNRRSASSALPPPAQAQVAPEPAPRAPAPTTPPASATTPPAPTDRPAEQPAPTERPAEQPAPTERTVPRSVQSEPDIPLPPEPLDEDEHVYSEDASSSRLVSAPDSVDDPDVMAHKLITEHLGARPLD